jgi:type II secretory pathway component PulF
VSTPLTLGDDCRAQLFTGLARALGAGMDPATGLKAVSDVCDGTLDRPIRRCASAVSKGSALGLTLERNGLISALDYAVVSVGETSGRLDQVFERLAARYSRAHARWRTLKGRLLLPGFTLMVAIVALPVPALFAGRLSTGRYVFNTLALMALMALCGWLARALALHWRAFGPPTPLTRAARALPLLRRLSLLHERAEVSDALALHLACGIPAYQALENLQQAQRNGVRRENLARARAALGAGAPLADALSEAGLLERGGGHAIVSAGEQAGRLDESLRHHARGLEDTLDSDYDLLAQWVPVIAYFSVAAVVAAGILG